MTRKPRSQDDHDREEWRKIALRLTELERDILGVKKAMAEQDEAHRILVARVDALAAAKHKRNGVH